MFLSVNTVKAQGPTATPIPGWGKETNLDWIEICDPDTLAPYESGFIPDDSGRFVQIVFLDNDFYTFYSQFDPPTSYQEEGFTAEYYKAEAVNNDCVWDAHVNIAAAPGSVVAKTPGKIFANNIEYADVSFLFRFFSYTGVPSVMWRDFEVKTLWDNGEITTYHDYISQTHNCQSCGGVEQQGWISIQINPQVGHNIDKIWLEFPLLDYSSIPLIGDYLNGFPPPVLYIDKLLIRGFYQPTPPTGTPTGTPTATRTPTVTRTPSATTTPRDLWDTPTPTLTATSTPTGTLTPTATPIPTKIFDWVFELPTKIPPLQLPAWPTPPTVVLWPSTPSSLFSLPLIPTPAPISPTSTLVPLNLSIVLTYPTLAAFVAPTETATPTPENTPAPGLECFDGDFSAPTMPPNWEITTGEFVAGSGIKLSTIEGNRLAIIHNPIDSDYTQINIQVLPYHFYTITLSSPGRSDFVVSAHNLTINYGTPEHYSGYDFKVEWPGEGEDIFIDHASYCTYIDPTPTPTATTTPTRADIIASLNNINGTLVAEAAWMTTPTTFTIQTAPITYAEHLPRPMANVGYTFENMQGDIGFMYDPRAWASLFGYIIGLPIAMVKFLYTLAGMMGPVGMFVTWLLILLPFTLWIKLALFIKNLVITIINLIIKLIRFIGDLWDLIPFG